MKHNSNQNRVLRKLNLLLIVVLILLSGGCSTKKETGNEVDWAVIAEAYGDDYPHLLWINDENKTIKILDEVHDFSKFEEEYGELWPFVVEFSSEEIEYALDIMIQLSMEIMEEMPKKDEFIMDSGVLVVDSSTMSKFSLIRRDIKMAFIETSTAPYMKYSRYYVKMENTVGTQFPATFYSTETRIGIGYDNYNDVVYEDKEWRVIEFILELVVLRTLYKQLPIGTKPEFFFEDRN